MSAQGTPPIPAGWYPDPQHPGQGRYWDGSAWTEHLHQPGQPAPKLRAPEGTDPSTVWIWILVLAPLVSVIATAFIPWGQYVRAMLGPDITNPSAMIDAELAFLTSPLYLGSLAVSFVWYAATVVLAYLDYRTLTARLVPKPFPWALTFIPGYGFLVYVIGRSIVVKGRTGRGLAPLWVTIAIFVLSMVVSFIVSFQIMGEMSDLLRTYDFG
jgi:hypothetical protein